MIFLKTSVAAFRMPFLKWPLVPPQSAISQLLPANPCIILSLTNSALSLSLPPHFFSIPSCPAQSLSPFITSYGLCLVCSLPFLVHYPPLHFHTLPFVLSILPICSFILHCHHTSNPIPALSFPGALWAEFTSRCSWSIQGNRVKSMTTCVITALLILKMDGDSFLLL